MTPSDPDENTGQARKEWRRYRRRRQRRSTLPGWLQNSPPAELQELIGAMGQEKARGSTRAALRGSRRMQRQMRHLLRWLRKGPKRRRWKLSRRWNPLILYVAAAILLWWFWPWLRPPVSPQASSPATRPDVVALPLTDPSLTSRALDIWASRPNALLALLAPGKDAHSISLVRNAGLSAEQRERVVVINTCGDTVTEIADLSQWLGSLPEAGQLTLVSSPAQIGHVTTISRVMLGGSGWRVEGAGSRSPAGEPASNLRLIRDHLRAQLWRAIGSTGASSWNCPGRAQGLG